VARRPLQQDRQEGAIEVGAEIRIVDAELLSAAAE